MPPLLRRVSPALRIHAAHTLPLALSVALATAPAAAVPPPASPPPSSRTPASAADSVYDVPPARPAAAGDDSIYDEPPPTTIYDEQEEADRLAKARTLFKMGVGLIDVGLWPEAYATLTETWRLKKHWQIAYQLARAEIATGHVQDAIQHLQAALSEADKDEKASGTRPKIRALLDEARGKLSHLHIAGSPPGAEVLVDGEARGHLPLSEPVTVDPGPHEVVLRLGERTASTRVTTASGQTSEAHLDIPLPRPASPPYPPAPDRTPMIVGLVGLGLGALGAVTGGVLWASAQDQRSRYEMLQNGPADPGGAQALEDAAAQADSQATGAAIVWIGAALLAGGGAGYWLFPQLNAQSSSPPSNVTLAPAMSPGHAGLVLTGRW